MRRRARTFAPALRDLLCNGEDLLARFHRARSGHDDDFIAAYLYSVSEFDDGAFRAKAAPGQFIRGADAMNFRHAEKTSRFRVSKSMRAPTAARMVLSFSGGAVDREAHAESGVR